MTLQGNQLQQISLPSSFSYSYSYSTPALINELLPYSALFSYLRLFAKLPSKQTHSYTFLLQHSNTRSVGGRWFTSPDVVINTSHVTRRPLNHPTRDFPSPWHLTFRGYRLSPSPQPHRRGHPNIARHRNAQNVFVRVRRKHRTHKPAIEFLVTARTMENLHC